MAEADDSSEHDLAGRRRYVRHSRLLVWSRPRNDLWNNTYVYVLHKPGQCCVQVWISANDGGLEQSAHANGNWCSDVNVCLLWQRWTRKARCRFRNSKCSNCGNTGHPRARCADNVRNLLATQVLRAAVARVLAKAARAVETQTSAIVVDRSVIHDLIALVERKVAVSVANVVI